MGAISTTVFIDLKTKLGEVNYLLSATYILGKWQHQDSSLDYDPEAQGLKMPCDKVVLLLKSQSIKRESPFNNLL